MSTKGCSLVFAKVISTIYIKVEAKLACITHPTKLVCLYYKVGAKNKCTINEAN